MHFAYVIYKITFPNGKIYIGKDIGADGHSLRYFGSWSNELVAQDFSKEALKNLTLTKEILFESEDKAEISDKEAEFILKYQSNNPENGYNRWPKNK
jgi:hypothetical protein